MCDVSTGQEVVLWIAGGVHILAGFIPLISSYTTKWIENRGKHISFATVLFLTGFVYFLQALGFGCTRRGEFWLEWIGYSISLFFISDTLTQFVASTTKYIDEFIFSQTHNVLLSAVGLGGVLGLFLETDAQRVVVLLATTLLYLVYLLALFQVDQRFGRYVLWVFTIGTLAYIVPYSIGLFVPDQSASHRTWRTIIYFIGNLITKLLVPFLEMEEYNPPKYHRQS